MYYYQFNIGDYASHTRNLSLLEDLAYRRLLDEYYLHEHPLSASVTDVARQIGFRDHEDSVKFVLDTFFVMTDKGYINPRADKEISHFHSKITQASNAGKASAQRRLNARSTDVQPTNNQQPITNNHKPNTTNTTSTLEKPSEVSDQIWEDFLTLRKAKKAPVNQTVLNLIKSQADKAGWSLESALSECVARGWVGFKAEWVKEETKKDFWEGRRVI
jgi:uncharacterized protein YdaU (DUF1376 family)